MIAAALLVARSFEVPSCLRELPLQAVGQAVHVDPHMAWNEAILSWNCDLPEGGMAEFYMKAGEGKYLSLGRWSNRKGQPSTSFNKQTTGDMRVDTDTFVSGSLKTAADILVTSDSLSTGLRTFTVCFANRSASAIETPGAPEVYGSELDVPRLQQSVYPGGEKLCSPTSVSMVLNYWGQKLNTSLISTDVPIAQQCIHDPAWPGTGNWSFNVAYAGSFPAMRAYVSRFWNIHQLERWIAKGVPVPVSVSRVILRGGAKKGDNDGHIVVLVGFTAEGDPIFNDPGREAVRMVYKRADFQRAWDTSGRTCYLIYPRKWIIPDNTEGCWL